MAKKKAGNGNAASRPPADSSGESPEVEPSSEQVSDKPAETFSIVGIGASAGGLKALSKFFASVPRDSGLAYVVVVHLAPENESHLPELLQPSSKMPVLQVTETVPLEPNHVYVIPPNANLDTIDTHLRLSQLEARRRERAPIDHFFRTLAKTHDGDAIGVVMTGTGSDGTLGLREIRAKGGLTIVQDPSEAEFDGMPVSAIMGTMIDAVLPIAQISQKIIAYARTRPNIPVAKDDHVPPDYVQLLHKIFAQLQSRTGRDYSRYKRATVFRRIQRRMQIRHIVDLTDYVDLIDSDSSEANELGDDLLITVTSFFRDPQVFQRVQEVVIPRLFQEKSPEDPIRVWSVGCATGEEAYSLAMLLIEYVSEKKLTPIIQVFASDLHPQSLQKAREGFYPGDIAVDVSPERLSRFFHKEDSGYRIRQEVRECVVFAPHNLLSDPPFSRLDLISCRNVLIYLQRNIQKDVTELFHYALRTDGFLLLGNSESLDGEDLFRLEDKKRCIYRKRNVPGPELKLPVFPVAPNVVSDESRRESGNKSVSFGMLHQRMVEQYGPPSILVSPDDKVVHLSEHAGKFLVLPGGELTLNVFKLVREEISLELRSAIRKSRETKRPVDSAPILMQLDAEPSTVIVHVRHALEPEQQEFCLVMFDERPIANDLSPTTSQSSAGGVLEGRQSDGEKARVEDELNEMRRRIQGIVEDYETSQEELKASNEELQSANEEMRSTLEELETSKEELQSMNEELQAVNQENRHKVEELAQLSGDLQNLMASTEIATLFLDRELRILRFTPSVSELFGIRPVDRGRPLCDFSHRLGYDGLADDAVRVIEKLIPISRELQDDAGNWYLYRVLPYRSTEDRIEGAVMTFVDISDRMQAEFDLRREKERFRALVDATAQMVWTTDNRGNVVEDSPTWRAFTGQTFDQWKGRGYLDAMHPDDREEAEQQWRDAIESPRPYTSELRIYHAATKDYRWTAVRAVPLSRSDGTVDGWVGMNTDITDRKRGEEALLESEKRYQAIVNQNLAGILQISLDGVVLWANEQFCKQLGYTVAEVEGGTIETLVHPEDWPASKRALAAMANDGQPIELDKRLLRKDGSVLWVHNAIAPVKNDSEVTQASIVSLDVTKRRATEVALREGEEELRRVNESLEEQVARRTAMLKLLQDITRVANEARTVEVAMSGALQLIAQQNGWKLGHVWRLAADNDRELVSSGIWHVDRDADITAEGLDTFQRLTKQTRCSSDSDLIGRVMATGRLHWSASLDAIGSWRRAAASKLGVHAVVMLPVFVEQNVSAVMEFFSDSPTIKDDRLFEIMPDVGIQLGQVIERKRLDRRVADATEREQRRIGQDIHDGVGQEIAGLKYLAQTHAESLQETAGRKADTALRIASGFETIQRQMRRIIRDLVPVEVDTAGLATALRSLADRTREDYGIDARFEYDDTVRVENSLLATHVYRIAQEAVGNAVKHADATTISIRLTIEHRILQLSVIDDGVGVESPTPESGLGLKTMTHRAELVGGELHIESPSGGGTQIRCRVPLGVSQ